MTKKSDAGDMLKTQEDAVLRRMLSMPPDPKKPKKPKVQEPKKSNKKPA